MKFVLMNKVLSHNLDRNSGNISIERSEEVIINPSIINALKPITNHKGEKQSRSIGDERLYLYEVWFRSSEKTQGDIYEIPSLFLNNLY